MHCLLLFSLSLVAVLSRELIRPNLDRKNAAKETRNGSAVQNYNVTLSTFLTSQRDGWMLVDTNDS